MLFHRAAPCGAQVHHSRGIVKSVAHLESFLRGTLNRGPHESSSLMSHYSPARIAAMLTVSMMLVSPSTWANAVGQGGQWFFHQAAAPKIQGLLGPLGPEREISKGVHLTRVDVQPSTFIIYLEDADGNALSHSIQGRLEGPGWASAPRLQLGVNPQDQSPTAEVATHLHVLIQTLRERATPDTLNALAVVNQADLRAEPSGPFGPSLGLSPTTTALGWLALGLLWMLWHAWRRRAIAMWQSDKRIPSVIAIDLICLSALWVRLLAADYAVFGADEVGFYETIWRAGQAGIWPVYGPAISGGEASTPGGLFFYALTPASWLGDDPRLAGQLVGVISVIALGLWAHLINRVFGPRTALIFTLLVAVHPWTIAYANRAWPSCFMVWWSAICLHGAWPSNAQRSPLWGGIALSMLIALPQIHLSAPVVWAVVVAWWVSARYWPSKRQLLVGSVGGILSYTPYLLLEWRQGWSNSVAMLTERTSSTGEHLNALLDGLIYLVLLGTSHIGELMHGGYAEGLNPRWQVLTSEGWFDLSARLGTTATTIVALSLFLTLLGWAWVIRDALVGPGAERRHLSRGIVAGALTTLVLLSLRGSIVFPHYVNGLLVLLTLPTVIILHQAIHFRNSKVALWVSATACLGLIVGFMMTSQRYHQEVSARSSVPSILSVAAYTQSVTAGRPFQMDLGGLIEPEALVLLSTKVLHKRWGAGAGGTETFTLLERAEREDGQGVLIGPLRLIHSNLSDP